MSKKSDPFYIDPATFVGLADMILKLGKLDPGEARDVQFMRVYNQKKSEIK